MPAPPRPGPPGSGRSAAVKRAAESIGRDERIHRRVLRPCFERPCVVLARIFRRRRVRPRIIALRHRPAAADHRRRERCDDGRSRATPRLRWDSVLHRGSAERARTGARQAAARSTGMEGRHGPSMAGDSEIRQPRSEPSARRKLPPRIFRTSSGATPRRRSSSTILGSSRQVAMSVGATIAPSQSLPSAA